MATVKYPEPLIFGLDIGTRSIVGTVGYREQERFHVVAMAVKYHDTRSMIDGQIHDIAEGQSGYCRGKTTVRETVRRTQIA